MFAVDAFLNKRLIRGSQYTVLKWDPSRLFCAFLPKYLSTSVMLLRHLMLACAIYRQEMEIECAEITCL